MQADIVSMDQIAIIFTRQSTSRCGSFLYIFTSSCLVYRTRVNLVLRWISVCLTPQAKEQADIENNKNECLDAQKQDYERKRKEKEAKLAEEEKKKKFKARAAQFE